MFYTTTICEVLNLNFTEVLTKELDQIKTLGIFNLR